MTDQETRRLDDYIEDAKRDITSRPEYIGNALLEGLTDHRSDSARKVVRLLHELASNYPAGGHQSPEEFVDDLANAVSDMVHECAERDARERIRHEDEHQGAEVDEPLLGR